MDFCNDVNDWLTVGGDLDLAEDFTGQDYAATINQLQSNGVTHVLDLRRGWDDRDVWVAEGLEYNNYCHAPIIDLRGHIPPEEWYTTIESFVRRFWQESYHGDRLYAHCQMGVNRGPSAGMLALLTIDPELHPWAAFHTIRNARSVAGVVYAEAVGVRHLARRGECFEEFSRQMRDFWTPEQVADAQTWRQSYLEAFTAA